MEQSDWFLLLCIEENYNPQLSGCVKGLEHGGYEHGLWAQGAWGLSPTSAPYTVQSLAIYFSVSVSVVVKWE